MISYAIFPQVAKKFFEDRQSGVILIEEPKVSQESKETKETRTTLLSKEDSKLNLQEIKELIKMIDETEISELNLESDGMKISIRKGLSVAAGIPVIATARQEGAERAVAPLAVHPSPSIEASLKAPELVGIGKYRNDYFSHGRDVL